MPIESPSGFLFTLEEMVASARGQPDLQIPHPVLLVVAPAEEWAETTAVRTTEHSTEPLSVTMLPTLVFTVHSKKHYEPNIRFGRSSACDMVMPFAAISKNHGFFQVDSAGNWTVGDLGSKNGIYIDGQKVLPNGLRPLRDGATLRFGDVTAKFLTSASFIADLKRRTLQA